MEYVYAALLLHKAGKPISEESITQLLSATGIKPDPVRVKALVASLEEVDIDEALKTAPVMAAPVAATPAKAEAKTEAKEEKKPEEEKEKEEAALEGLGALFG